MKYENESSIKYWKQHFWYLTLINIILVIIFTRKKTHFALAVPVFKIVKNFGGMTKYKETLFLQK